MNPLSDNFCVFQSHKTATQKRERQFRVNVLGKFGELELSL